MRVFRNTRAIDLLKKQASKLFTMENEELDVDFQSSLEPDVIITDGSSDGYGSFAGVKRMFRAVRPEISIIPLKRKVIEAPSVRQTTVRLVTKEEVVKVENAFKRKSLPLEQCPVCKKFFRRMKTHLQKHESIRRDASDPLTCRFCLKSFNTGSNLSIHMRTHTGDKPYRCEVCTKGFAQSCNLVNHMRIHTGERPFKCPFCERAFTQSGNLSNHVRLHTDEKPFKCHFCDKAFTQSGNLNSHIRNNHKFLENVRPIVFSNVK